MKTTEILSKGYLLTKDATGSMLNQSKGQTVAQASQQCGTGLTACCTKHQKGKEKKAETRKGLAVKNQNNNNKKRWKEIKGHAHPLLCRETPKGVQNAHRSVNQKCRCLSLHRETKEAI